MPGYGGRWHLPGHAHRAQHLQRQRHPGLDAGPNGSLVNQASGLCLDDPGLQTGNGTQLQIYSCNGGPNQFWWLPEL